MGVKNTWEERSIEKFSLLYVKLLLGSVMNQQPTISDLGKTEAANAEIYYQGTFE